MEAFSFIFEVALFGIVMMALWVYFIWSKGMKPKWRYWTVAILTIPIVLAIVYWQVGYTFAVGVSPLLIFPLAACGFTLLILLFFATVFGLMQLGWIGKTLTVLLELAFYIAGLVAVIIGLAVVSLRGDILPAASGRVSPTASYAYYWNAGSGGWFSGLNQMKIYQNPKWFPLVQREVMSVPLNFSPASGADISVKQGSAPGKLEVHLKDRGKDVMAEELDVPGLER